MNFRTDNPERDVLRVLAEFRLCIDPQYRGELARLFEHRGYRRLYYKRHGLTLDSFTEVLLDRGITRDRPTPNELLDYLDDLLFNRAERKKPGRKRATANTIDGMERHARVTRLRLYQCDRCGQKLRGTRETDVVCGRCLESAFESIARGIADALCDETIAEAAMLTVRECIQRMRRKDPLPEEILAQSFATMEGTAA